MSLNEYHHKQIKPKKVVQKRFQVKKTNMEMVTIKKTQFAGLNGKRFYFFDGIVSLPFSHHLLEDVKQEKKDLKKGIHRVIQEKKYDLLKTEALAVRQ